MKYYTPYVLRVKYPSTDPQYFNGGRTIAVKEARNNGDMEHYLLTKDAAEAMFTSLHQYALGIYGTEFEYIALVSVSNYPPYGEYEVIRFREFK